MANLALAVSRHEWLFGFIGIVLAVSALLFGRLFRREHQRQQRREQRLCVGCGYDVRVAPKEVCPECGLPVQPPVFELDPVALNRDWPEENVGVRILDPGEGRVLLHEDESGLRLQLLAEQLEARGVWSEMRTRETFGMVGVVSVPVMSYQLMVAAKDAQRARGIMERFRRAPRGGVNG